MAAQYGIDIKLALGKALSDLDKLTAKFKQVDRASEALQKSINKIPQAFKGIGPAAEKAFRNATAAGLKFVRKVDRATKGLTKSFASLGGVISGAGAGFAVASAVRTAATYEQLQARIKVLTAEYGDLERVQNFVAESAKKFGLSQIEAAQGVSNIYARLRPLGVELADIETTFAGFQTVARLSGATAQEASAAFTQLAQALGSGRLQGDEFRSIAEQVPGLLVAISKETNIAAGDLKKLASDGKITADVVINALKSIEAEGGDALKELLANSPNQRFKDFSNAVEDLSRAFGQNLLPVLTPVVKGLTALLNVVNGLPGPVKVFLSAVTALGAAFLVIAPAVGAAVIAIKAIGGAAIAAFALAAAKVILVVGAIVALGAALKAAYDNFEPFRNLVNFFVDFAQRSGRAIAAFYDEFINGANGIAAAWSGNTQKIADVWTRVTTFLAEAWNSTTTKIAEIWTATKNFIIQNFGFLVTAWNKIVNFFQKAWAKAMQYLPKVAAIAVRAVLSIFGPLAPLLEKAGVRLGSAVAGGLAAGIEAFKTDAPDLAAELGATGPTGKPIGTERYEGKGKGKGKGKGSSSKGPADNVAQLSQELTVQQNLFEIERQRRQALEAGNGERLVELDTMKELNKLNLKLGEIERSNQTEASKVVARKLAQLEYDRAAYKIAEDYEQLKRQTYDDAIKGIDAQIAAGRAITAEQKRELELQGLIDQAKENGVKFTQEEIAALRSKLELRDEELEKLKQLQEQQAKLKQLYESIGGTIRDGITDAIVDAVEGGKDLQKILANTLRTIGTTLIKSGVSGLGTAAGIPGFSEGGIAPAGRPSLVGENGPELIRPLTPTVVSPFEENSKTLATQVARAATLDAFDENGQAIAGSTTVYQNNSAEKQAAAMQAEGSEMIRFESFSVGGIDVVSRNEAEAIGQRAAKQARAQVYRDLKNKPGVRAGVGV